VAKFPAPAAAILLFLGLSAVTSRADGAAPVELPSIAIAGISFDLETTDAAILEIHIEDDGGQRSTLGPETTSITLPKGGNYTITIVTADGATASTVRAVPGIITILPPVVAILMALVFRQVVIALFTGVWLGALFITGHDFIRSFFYVVDHYVVESLSGSSGADHTAIAVFTLLLGGMVGVFSRIGGTQGVVNEISRLATTPRRGQIATWLMGIAIFFDDYTNTLIVGNTMRAITDKLRISREKLSYIVDSTAAPVACVAVITSWIGFEISLIKDSFDALGIDRNPLMTFIASIQYSFYPLLTLVFGLTVAVTTRDFGPMLKAERRARRSGRLLSEKAVPISNIDQDIQFDIATTPRWYNAAIPILVVVVGTFVGLVITGRASLVEAGVTHFSVIDTIRESNSFDALLWSSLCGCVTAILLGLAQRLASLTEIMNAWGSGVKSMVPALVILVMAWCIGQVCTDLKTADYLVAKVSGFLHPGLLPTLIFLVAAAVSFSTGTSWGTMTILTPITIPLVVRVSEMNLIAPGHHESILLSSIAAILAGSVFGDHCSPISDTTIMSSMASGSDHVDHVRTQLPYAATVALIAVLVGYIPTGFNFPSFATLALGVAAVIATVRFLGKPEDSYL